MAVAMVHTNGGCVLSTLVALVVLGSCGAVQVRAQQSELETRLLEGAMEPADSMGVRVFREVVDSLRTDSAHVYYNVRGEPVAWRAWIDGRHVVFWEPFGRFVVPDSVLRCLAVYRRHRQLLEMLDGLELVEQAARRAGATTESAERED